MKPLSFVGRRTLGFPLVAAHRVIVADLKHVCEHSRVAMNPAWNSVHAEVFRSRLVAAFAPRS